MTTTIETFARAGSKLMTWENIPYKTSYGQIGLGDRPEWRVESVMDTPDVIDGQEYYFVEAVRLKADGTAGKTRRYFWVSPRGSVKPA